MKPTARELDEYGEVGRLSLAFVTAIETAMRQQNVSRSALARRLGFGRSHVSNTLNRTASVTLRTLVRFGLALGVRFRLTVPKSRRPRA